MLANFDGLLLQEDVVGDIVNEIEELDEFNLNNDKTGAAHHYATKEINEAYRILVQKLWKALTKNI